MRVNSIVQFLKSQSMTNRIAIIFIVNILIVIVILSCSLVIQYVSIKRSQEQLPRSFFEAYNNYSLQEVAVRTKNLIISGIDFRLGYVTAVTDIIKTNQAVINQNISDAEMQQISSPSPGRQFCRIFNKNQTIFDCRMGLYTKLVSQSKWTTFKLGPARRFNIIYQNLENKQDVMMKSISDNPELRDIIDVTKINEKFESIQKPGTLRVSPFYPDYNGFSDQDIVSFYTKLLYPNYRVLIQIQTFGSFIRTSITRVIYSDDTNIVVLSKNISTSTGYSLVASFQQLSNELNYTNLLQLGTGKTVLADNKVVYSYTTSFSSQYKIGSFNTIDSKELNRNFVIVVHSRSITQQMQNNVYNIISSLFDKLIQILIMLFFLICLWMVVNILLFTNKLREVLNQIKELTQKYTKQPGKYLQLINQVNKKSYNDYVVGFLLKGIIQIVNTIEHNKKKFRKKSLNTDKNYYPLNQLHKQFLQTQQIHDQSRFEDLRKRLIETQNFYKQKKSRQLQQIPKLSKQQ